MINNVYREKVKVTIYTLDPPKAEVARYTLDDRLISPLSHHKPSAPNRKLTCLNDTTSRITFITRPTSQEASLKDM